MKLFLHMVATTVRAGLHIMRHRKPMHTDDRTNLVGAVTKREVPRKADVPQHLQCLLR